MEEDSGIKYNLWREKGLWEEEKKFKSSINDSLLKCFVQTVGD